MRKIFPATGCQRSGSWSKYCWYLKQFHPNELFKPIKMRCCTKNSIEVEGKGFKSSNMRYSSFRNVHSPIINFAQNSLIISIRQLLSSSILFIMIIHLISIYIGFSPLKDLSNPAILFHINRNQRIVAVDTLQQHSKSLTNQKPKIVPEIKSAARSHNYFPTLTYQV